MHISEPLATALMITGEPDESLGRWVSLLLGQRPVACEAGGLIRS